MAGMDEMTLIAPMERVSIRDRLYYYLMTAHSFKRETLDLLNIKNLKQLAVEYGFNSKVRDK